MSVMYRTSVTRLGSEFRRTPIPSQLTSPLLLDTVNRLKKVWFYWAEIDFVSVLSVGSVPAEPTIARLVSFLSDSSFAFTSESSESRVRVQDSVC